MVRFDNDSFTFHLIPLSFLIEIDWLTRAEVFLPIEIQMLHELIQFMRECCFAVLLLKFLKQLLTLQLLFFVNFRIHFI